MFKRIDHVEIVCLDFEKGIDFYMGVLGFAMKQRMKVDAGPLEEIAYLTLGDTMLELMRVKDPSSSLQEPWEVGIRMMAIEVEDMDEAIAYLTKKGVPVTWGPMTMGPTKRAEIKDPEGNSIELRQWG